MKRQLHSVAASLALAAMISATLLGAGDCLRAHLDAVHRAPQALALQHSGMPQPLAVAVCAFQFRLSAASGGEAHAAIDHRAPASTAALSLPSFGPSPGRILARTGLSALTPSAGAYPVLRI